MSTVEFTSDIVRSTRFREKMRGYHPEEVDAFLERTATALDVLQARLAEVTERAMKAEAALESNSEADESIRRTLTLAQRTAEMAVKEANDEAERIRTDADEAARQLRQETDAECRRLVEEATIEAETMRQEATDLRDRAQADASTMVADAEREVAERRRDCDEAIATAQRSADAALAEQAAAARRELDATIASLTAQRYELRLHVEALAEYLAGERARVLDALTGGVERFGETLVATPHTALMDAALSAPAPATEDVPGDSAAELPVVEGEPEGAVGDADAGPEAVAIGDVDVPAETGADPVDPVPSDETHAGVDAGEEPAGPAAVWFPDAVSDERDAGEQDAEVGAEPAALLFTLGDEGRRSDPEVSAPEGRGRKTLLGRRRG